MSSVFISQCTKDSEIANSLFELLCVGVGINAEDIVNTSLEGAGVPQGEDFVHFLKSELQGAECVVTLISQNYYHSTFCVSELGGAWATCKKIFPIIVPPMSYGKMDAILKNTQSALITDKTKLTSFAQELAELIGVKFNGTRWEVSRDKFLDKIAPLLESQEHPNIVGSDEHDELKSRFEAVSSDYSVLLDENATLKRDVEQLKQMKNADDVREYVSSKSTFKDHFIELTAQISNSLSDFGNLERQYIFYEATNREPSLLNQVAKDDPEALRIAEERNYIINSGMGFCEINTSKPKIRKLLDQISEMRILLDDVEDDFWIYYESTFSSDADISDKEFWEEHFDL